MNAAAATREVYWNITQIWVMYALLVPTLVIAGYGIFRRVHLWRRGKPAQRFDQPLTRLKLLMRDAVLQRRTWQEPFAGTLHAFLWWGFIVLTIATTVVFIEHDFGVPLMHGWFYLVFQSFVVDLFGGLALLGVGMAATRRWLWQPQQLVYTWEASLLLVLMFAILAGGFLLEGWRIAATNDPWGAWSPFGYLIAAVSRRWMNDGSLRLAHAVCWWLHLALVFVLVAWAPYTKLVHPLTAALNIYTGPLARLGASLAPISFETEQRLGVNALADFTWKDLLDLDACTECGRCTAVCPANAVGKALSPRDLILDLRRLLHGSNDPAEPFIGATAGLSAEALWACTTCGACMEACPVSIAQMPKIVDARRHIVMEQADFPQSLQDTMESLETRGHPFRGTQASRLDWAAGLDVPQLADAPDADVLLWVGCGGALVERNQKVTRAVAQLLKRAGVKFAVLGREEKCTGDLARRIGQEFLFQNLARENIDTMRRYAVKTIVTACPHCFNTFRNEYPQFGGHFEVYHHSEYLAKLVDEGRLAPEQPTDSKVAFHDPCYLGRHNGVFDAPRRLLEISASDPPVEMPRNRQQSFCCGGGGGLSFVEEPASQRVNRERAREALETGADVVAVGCPFCLTMLEDGVNAAQGSRETKVMDVAELLWDAVRANPNEDA